MSVANSYGWDAAAKVWRKVLVNGEGKLIIDPSEIFEDPPTDGEAGKAPTSNWAYDHAADISAHHVRYSDVEALWARYNSKMTLTGGVYTVTDVTGVGMLYLDTSGSTIHLKGLAGGTEGHTIVCIKNKAQGQLWVYSENASAPEINRLFTSSTGSEIITSGQPQIFVIVYTGNRWFVERYLFATPGALFQDTPVDGTTSRGATSNWAFDHNANVDAHHTKFTITEHDTADRHALANLDPLVCSEVEADSKITTHKGDASAHHARYTDAEAVAAVGYNGTKYWSCNGVHFDGVTPSTDNLTKSVSGYLTVGADGVYLTAHVALPHGATVTSVLVQGNAAAAAETWTLRRVKVSDITVVTMATAAINTADTTITSPVVDNSLYTYMLFTSSLDTDDQVWGAVITYTI